MEKWCFIIGGWGLRIYLARRRRNWGHFSFYCFVTVYSEYQLYRCKVNFIFYLYHIQYFQDAHTTEQKMIQLVQRLNTEYDVQNISTRDAAEQALNSLTVSAWNENKLNF